MCHCVELFRQTPLIHIHKLCNIIWFSSALKHNKSSNNHVTIIRNVFKFTLKLLGTMYIVTTIFTSLQACSDIKTVTLQLFAFSCSVLRTAFSISFSLKTYKSINIPVEISNCDVLVYLKSHTSLPLRSTVNSLYCNTFLQPLRWEEIWVRII